MRIRHLLGGAFALLLLLPLRAVAENISAPDPDSWDYGQVEIGSSASMSWTFESLGPENPVAFYAMLLLCEFQPCTADSGFEIVSVTEIEDNEVWNAPYLYDLPAGNHIEVVVAFTPNTEGIVSAMLYIASNAVSYPTMEIPLQGEGVTATPDEMMLDLIDFYDEAIAEGWLSGKNRGQSGTSTDAVFRDMLVDIYDLIVAGNDRKACRALVKAMLRIDSASSPPDLVTGDVAPVVYAKLTEVFVALECE